MEIRDMSGLPRSDEELQEAIDCVKTIMVKHSLVLPLFTINALCIKNCLEELQFMRRMIAEARKKRLDKDSTPCID